MGPQQHMKKLLAILGGDLVRDVATGKWRTTTFEDAGDKFGILGDQLRVIAGWHLYQKDPISPYCRVGRGEQFGLRGSDYCHGDET